MEDTKIFTLDNGIRVVHTQVNNTKIIHCGIILDIGSRDEEPDQYGIAHFWEHMAFKGTKRRKAYHIYNSLDSVGGELNAYTTKEKICFYASVLDTFDDKAVELLTDITFNATFPEKQLEKERQVILEEMAMYQDTPEDAILDEFDEIVFKGNSMAHNILGTNKNVKSFKRDDFTSFINGNINTERIVVSFVGNLPLKRIQKLAQKHLAPIPRRSSKKTRRALNGYQPEHVDKKRDILQSHFAMGMPAFPITHKQRVPFAMLVNLLGGPGMNTRLNMALRERLGYVYGIDANYLSYSNTGLLSIVFATEKKNLKRSINVVHREIKKLKEIKLGRLQLHSLKEQMMGHLAMAAENNVGIMISNGKSLLDLNEIHTIDDVFEEIKAVTAEELLELANQELNIDNMSTLTYLPKNNGAY
ncbi:MAG: pitrilysin family protein [Bacteroidota bacterium]